MFFWLLLYLYSLWLLNTAPAFNLPLTPELWGVALAIFLAGQRLTTPLRRTSWRPLNWESVGVTLLALHLLILSLRALLAAYTGWPLSCTHALGAMQQLECLFQAATDQNSALRLLGYDLTAAAIFWTSYALSKKQICRPIPKAIVLVGVSFAIISLTCKSLKIEALLPSAWLTNEFRTERMSFLMQNPTWVWPYLFPSLLGLAWFWSPSSNRIQQGMIALSACAVWLTCIYTQQRGAALLVCLCIVSMLSAPVLGYLRHGQNQHRRWMPPLGAGLGCALLACLIWLSATHIGQFINLIGGGDRLTRTSFTASSRWQIWQTAMLGIQQKPWVGHGYGSWYASYGSLIGQIPGAELRDTAHNYFVQTIFELGILQLLLALGGMLCLVIASWRAALDKNKHGRLLLFAALGYALIATVQEFNFIRSAYYTHALMLGWLLGASRIPQTTIANKHVRKKTSHWYLATTVSALLIGLSVWLSFNFSLAGYPYEANALAQYQPRVRWLRPNGTLTFTKWTVDPNLYAVYPVGKFFANSYRQTQLGDRSTQQTIFIPDQENNLAVRVRSPISIPDWIDFDHAHVEMGRSLSAMLFWPPLLSSLPITGQNGMLNWENSPGDASKKIRWCGQDCSLRLQPCPNGKSRWLNLRAARHDVTNSTPLEVEFFTSTNWGDLIHAPRLQTLLFSDPNTDQALEVVGDVYFRLKSSRSFTPRDGDDRKLGVLLVASFCKKQ